MKKATALICVALCICCVFATACGSGNGGGQSAFVFLSVRMKGNGDGTLTAVGKNEFALTEYAEPVTLTLFYSDEYGADVNKMTETASVYSEGLKIFEALEIKHEIKTAGYYCARITYTAGVETRHLQSSVIYYDLTGNRIADMR